MIEKRKYQSLISSGFVIIAIFVGISFIPFFKSDGGRLIQGSASILLRLVTCFWIADVTKRQNRERVPYIIMAVIIPAITLIIVGIIGDKKK